MKLIKIEWWDHCTFAEAEWRSRERVENIRPMLVTSVGYIIKETKKYYVIASTISEQEDIKNEFLILKGTIKKVKEL